MLRNLIIMFTVLPLAVVGTAAGSMETPVPPAGGMTSREVLQQAVATRSVASAVGLVSRRGQVVLLEAVGEAGPGVPMRPDAICRLASITKPVTAVSVLMLAEAGVLSLSDPLSRYLPEFAAVRVGTAAPARPITIQDLLTHQAGLPPDGTRELDLIWDKAATPAEFASLLAKVPLRFDPGIRFEYGPAFEVLTALVEKVTGKSFAAVLDSQILGPLGMSDTFFRVPEAKLGRLAAQYRKDAAGAFSFFRNPGQEEGQTAYFSGGGGLRSTVQDFHRFALMLMRGGEAGGVRLLSAASVKLMTSNHAGDSFPAEGWGWGFGVKVRTSTAGADPESVGAFGWNGGTGTLFLVDPSRELIVVLFAPSVPGMRGVSELRRDFVAAAYREFGTGAPVAAH